MSNDYLHVWGEDELDTLLQQGVDGTEPGRKVLEEFAVVADASEKGAGLLGVLGHGHLGEGGNLVGVRANAGGGDGVSQEIGVGGAELGLGGGKFEVVLSKAFEEGSDVGNVSGGVRIENDDVVQVGGDAFEVLDDLVDDFNEPARRGVATLRHDEPLEEAGGGAERGEGDGVFVDGDLVER